MCLLIVVIYLIFMNQLSLCLNLKPLKLSNNAGKSYSLKLNNHFIPIWFKRECIIWLPPDYTTDQSKKHPVLYCHDGQNMIDDNESWLGHSWDIINSVTNLIEKNEIESPVLVVIPNSDRFRYVEYDYGPVAENFVDWMADVLKPEIEKTFNVKTDPNSNFQLGSSLGGTISMLATYYRSDTFGGCACLSPSFGAPLIADVALNGKFRKNSVCGKVKIFISNGGDDEESDIRVNPFDNISLDWENLNLKVKGFFWIDTSLQIGIDNMLNALRFSAGLKVNENEDRLLYKKYPGDAHNEIAWKKRVFEPLLFLLKKE